MKTNSSRKREREKSSSSPLRKVCMCTWVECSSKVRMKNRIPYPYRNHNHNSSSNIPNHIFNNKVPRYLQAVQYYYYFRVYTYTYSRHIRIQRTKQVSQRGSRWRGRKGGEAEAQHLPRSYRTVYTSKVKSGKVIPRELSPRASRYRNTRSVGIV